MVRPLSGIALRERALGALTLAWVAQALTNPSEAAGEVALAVLLVEEVAAAVAEVNWLEVGAVEEEVAGVLRLLVSAAEPGASDAERPWVLVFREIED